MSFKGHSAGFFLSMTKGLVKIGLAGIMLYSTWGSIFSKTSFSTETAGNFEDSVTTGVGRYLMCSTAPPDVLMSIVF